MACVPRFAPLYTNSREATILLRAAGELSTMDVGVSTDRRESVPFRMDTTDGEDHASFMTGKSSTPPLKTRGMTCGSTLLHHQGAEPQPNNTGGAAGATSISSEEGGPPSTDAVTKIRPRRARRVVGHAAGPQ